MKTRLLMIIGIIAAAGIAISLAYYAINDSATTVFLSCDSKYQQIGDKCVLLKPEQYCKDWCDAEELSKLGCDRLALDYIFMATNIIDGNPDEPYYWNWIGMPDGLSEEEFERCSEILKEKRTEFQPHSGLGMLNQAEQKCEEMGGTWDINHCLVTQEIFDSNKLTCDPGPVIQDKTCSSNGVVLVIDSKITYPEFSDGVVEIINPKHSPLKYKITIPVIDDTYLSKSVEQWNDAWRSEMEFQHGIHGDEFYTELGRLLIKNEMQYQMNALGIVNANDDFEVYNGMSMQSLPPHIDYSAVVHATDGNYYRLQGGTHANQVSYYKTSQLQFPDPDEEIPVESLLSKPQSITIIPEDGHKSRQVPSTLVIHIDNNTVEFFNNTPETIRIQDNGSGMIGEENTLDWMGPIILPYQNATMTFDKPGLYEWDGRNAPNLDRPLWWKSHANGHIVVLSDEINNFSRGDKAKIAQKMLHATDLPLVSSGAGNAKQVLMIGIDRAVINTVPGAEEYYLKRAHQLIPFDVEIIMYE